MGKFSEKYGGKIIFDKNNDGKSVCVKCKNTEINISVSECDIYGEKLKLCSDIIEKYIEINEMAKKAVSEIFSKKGTVKYYLECKFNIGEKDMEIYEEMN